METALVPHNKPRAKFWEAFWAALGWKVTAHVEQPRYETTPAADSSLTQRITELEKGQQGLQAKLELTNQLLTQYKASLDRSDRAIESLELQSRTQQELIFNLIRNFNKDLSTQAEKFKSDLQNHEQAARANDEERESQITYLFNKLFALDASYRMEKRAPGMDSSSSLPTTQLLNQHQTPTSSQDQVPKDGTQVDTDVQLRSPSNLATVLDPQQSTIYAIIDGDGHIFDASLLKRGAQGGVEAAKLLMDNLTAYYQQNFLDASSSLSDLQLRVNIFLNSRGLQHVLASREICTATQYDNFMAGFTQSNPKILICDVRSGKDAADMKVREHLLDYARNPTVTKIFFGGCHDTGYTTPLNTLLNEGLLSKVILLQGYKHMHKKISSFNLPLLVIPGLFMEDRLPRNPPKSSTSPEDVEEKTIIQRASGSSKAEDKFNIVDDGKQKKASPIVTGITITVHPSPPPTLPPSTPATPAKSLGSSRNIISSLSSQPAYLLQTNETKNGPTGISVKGIDLSDETSDSRKRRKRSGRRRDSDSSDDRPAMPNLLFQRMRLANRPKGAPSPCYYFYVGNKCPAGEKCKLGHFYLLKPEELKHLKNEGAKRPCLAVQKNLPCILGSECPMAHKCPHGTECKQYAQQGRKGCQFKGENMHK